MPSINLPNGDGKLESYTLGAPRDFPKATPPFSRVALAAAHVVADPLAEELGAGDADESFEHGVDVAVSAIAIHADDRIR